MKLVLKVILIPFALIFSLLGSAQNLNTPIGSWQQWDDVTGRPHSVIQIWQQDDGTLSGKVVKGYPDANGVMPPKNCSKCQGNLKDKPIVGMTILSGFTQTDNDQWGHGQILDPDSGKIYRCQLTLIENGQQLKVRGYIGVTLLGRTQVWKRMEEGKKKD